MSGSAFAEESAPERLAGFQRQLLALAAIALLLSCISPPFPHDMLLQHIPTVVALLALLWLLRRYPMSDASVACIISFLLLHILGARYVYSFVPYDRWIETMTGVSLADSFGFQRNHYDRLVHFAYGALWVQPVHELLWRHLRLSRRLAAYIAIEFVLASSLLYELFEWGLTLVMAPQAADIYNGQQGDMWDAQKDMFCATLGATITTIILFYRQRRAA